MRSVRGISVDIECALIGGDDIIPAKDLHVSRGGYAENDMPEISVLPVRTARMTISEITATVNPTTAKEAGTLIGGEPIVEAAVDAFSVTQYNCYNCDCPGYCDLDASGAINPVDVVHIVNYVYKSLDARILSSATCPGVNGDWNNDGDINPIDVVFYVNCVYKSSGTGPDDPCSWGYETNWEMSHLTWKGPPC